MRRDRRRIRTRCLTAAIARQLCLVSAGCWLLSWAVNSSSAQTPSPSTNLQAQLIARLAATDEETRKDAVVHLGNLFRQAPEAMPQTVIAALGHALQNDHSPVVRALAAHAFEVAGDMRVAPLLLAALGGERQAAVRKAIIYALARYPAPQVTAALMPLLQDKQAEMRGTVAYALAEIADPAATSALLDVLRRRSGDEDAFARTEAARGLGRIGAAEASAQLVTALTHDKAPAVRRAAATALGHIGRQQDTAVIEALRAASLAADPYLSREAEAAVAQINARSARNQS